jgi:hypothetical protein
MHQIHFLHDSEIRIGLYFNAALLNVYPNNILMYAFHFGFPLSCSASFSAILYAKNQHMRSTLAEELEDIFRKNNQA